MKHKKNQHMTSTIDVKKILTELDIQAETKIWHLHPIDNLFTLEKIETLQHQNFILI